MNGGPRTILDTKDTIVNMTSKFYASWSLYSPGENIYLKNRKIKKQIVASAMKKPHNCSVGIRV